MRLAMLIFISACTTAAAAYQPPDTVGQVIERCSYENFDVTGYCYTGVSLSPDRFILTCYEDIDGDVFCGYPTEKNGEIVIFLNSNHIGAWIEERR